MVTFRSPDIATKRDALMRVYRVLFCLGCMFCLLFAQPACAGCGDPEDPCLGTATTRCDEEEPGKVFSIDACGEVTGVRQECEEGARCVQRTPNALAICAQEEG